MPLRALNASHNLPAGHNLTTSTKQYRGTLCECFELADAEIPPREPLTSSRVRRYVGKMFPCALSARALPCLYALVCTRANFWVKVLMGMRNARRTPYLPNTSTETEAKLRQMDGTLFLSRITSPPSPSPSPPRPPS